MTARFLIGLAVLLSAASGRAEDWLFQDNFTNGPGTGWTWLREEKPAWRPGAGALEMRVLPGNLWGGANNVKNVLLRPAPDPAMGPVEILVTVSNRPTHQYEQANLAWYYDDSHMVKLGLELVNGDICIVMGREQADRTRTLAKIPVTFTEADLRLRVDGNQIRGQYRPAGSAAWLDAGAGDLPAPAGGTARISLHVYQGDPATEHWARFAAFRIRRVAP